MEHSTLEMQLVKQQYQLAEAVIELSKGGELEAILQRAAVFAKDLTNAKYAMLAYVQDGKKHFIPLGLTDQELADLGGQEPQGVGILGLMWDQREVVRINHIAQHKKSAGFPTGHPAMDTFLGSPIMAGDAVDGVIYLTEKLDGRAFTPLDENVVRTLASACAVAISNSREIRDLKARNAELESQLAGK